jgi:hypothetical protein
MDKVKQRLDALEGILKAGEPVILLDEIDGRYYRRNGEETTIEKEREKNKNAVFLVDNIRGLTVIKP